MTILKTSAAALAVSLAFAVPASAGPLPTGTATIKDATADHVTDVQWRGRHHHRGWGPGIGIGAGIAAGALIGSAVAARPYYGGGYYYDEPVYAQPYAYEAEPVYPTYSYGYRRGYGSNYCEEGYRRVPCTQGGGY